jgi:hypothetical protein
LRNTCILHNKNVHCYRCGKGRHSATQYTLSRDIKCRACGTQRHLQSVCFKNKSETHQLEEILSATCRNDILQLELNEYRDKFITQLQVNDKKIDFEVDSGAAVTIVNKTHMLKLFPNSTINSTNLQLLTFCENTLQTVRYIVVNVKYKNIQRKLNIYLINVHRKPLLGREFHRVRRYRCLAERWNAI